MNGGQINGELTKDMGVWKPQSSSRVSDSGFLLKHYRIFKRRLRRGPENFSPHLLLCLDSQTFLAGNP